MNIPTITIEGKEYPLVYTNLSVSSRYDSDGVMDVSIAARFVPTRIENGSAISAEDHAITFFRGSLSELKDTAEVQAVTAIKTALENFMVAKLT